MLRRMKGAIAFAVFVAVVGAGRPGRTGGIYVPGAGPSAQARAGAFVAKSDDPSAIAHNPAGFAKLDGTHISIGANLVDYDLRYRRTGAYEPSGEAMPESYEGAPYPEVEDISRPEVGIGEFQIAPTIAVSTDLGHPEWPVRFGIGLVTPQGYSARKFPQSHDLGDPDAPAPGPQRYDTIDQRAYAILPSVAVSYSPIPQLDIGVRLSWGISGAEGQRSVWAIRNYEEYEGRDSVFVLDHASDPFVPAYGAGVLYRPLRSLEVGIAYSSALHIRSKGEAHTIVGDAVFEDATTLPVPDEFAQCAPGGREDALKVCMSADVPQTATAGARWVFFDPNGREQGDIELDVGWEDWSASSNVVTELDAMDSIGQFLNPGVIRHGFRDTYSFRLGGSWALPLSVHRLVLRGGAAWDTAAAPDQYTRVDVDGKARATLATGVAFETSRFRVELGGGVVLEPDVTVETCKPPDGPSVGDVGCTSSGDTPVLDRESPDPIQPKQGELNQIESPFNSGTYESGYLLFSLGFTTWF